MPEKPEVEGTAYIIAKAKGSGLGEKDLENLKFFVQVILLCFSTGSEKRSYTTFTANKEAYTTNSPVSESAETSWITPSYLPQWPPASWIERTAEEPWAYLLEPPRTLGTLICVTRGKLIALAAGNHAVCISLGLEAHLFGMSPEDFFEIISHDIPGPNPDADKAKRIRTFAIPNRLVVSGSSDTSPRTIKIFCAFISPKWVYVLSDFSGLVRMHVKSKDTPWTREELAVGTSGWYYLFESFKGGPDWELELDLASSALDRWRKAILEEHRRWKIKVKKLKAKYDEKYPRIRLDSYFSVKSGQPLPTTSAPPFKIPSEPMRPILKEICSNSMGAFSGFGRHTSNDFLFTLAIFPGMPSRLICEDEAKFQSFANAISEYLATFTTATFLTRVASVTNSDNPFKFNETSNSKYMGRYILVFRRIRAMVDGKLYIKYCKEGLYDPAHTIGQPYPEEKANVLINKFKKESGQFKWKPVFFYGGTLRAYSVIEAKVPKDWGEFGKTRVTKDITHFGYMTTIGLAQFHEQLLNRVVKPIANNRGHPSTERTGRRGRPAKLKPLKAKPRGRTSGRKGFGVVSADMDDMEVVSIPDDDHNDDVAMDVDPDLPEGGSECIEDEDVDDNAGDADLSGDGSECIGDPFGAYEDADSEDDVDSVDSKEGDVDEEIPESMVTENVMEVDSEDQSLEKEKEQSRKERLVDVLNQSIDSVLRDARFALDNFQYQLLEPRPGKKELNPYNSLGARKKIPLPPPGVMTYREAHKILRTKTYSSKYMQLQPFLIVAQKFGTTLPASLREKGITNDQIHTIVDGARASNTKNGVAIIASY